ncbi:MAG: DUF4339 domain-containing protein [Planctomycetota bacterium]|jgi:hypothetical protein
MQWYYLSGSQRVGPLTDTEFQQHVDGGDVSVETSVWHEGLSEWTFYGQVSGASLAIAPADARPPLRPEPCWQCGHYYERDDLLEYQGMWVCASCKIRFFQRIRMEATSAVSGPTAFHCTQCTRMLQPGSFNLNELTPCRTCGTLWDVTVFPAMAIPPRRGRAAQALADEEEASCFYHPHKRAAVPCDECGRFLCALCDIEIDQRHLCPTCLQADPAGQGLGQLEGERRTYDGLALILGIIPLCIITPLASLFLCVRFWRSPPSLVRRTRLRFAIAAAISLIWLGAIGLWWTEIFG